MLSDVSGKITKGFACQHNTVTVPKMCYMTQSWGITYFSWHLEILLFKYFVLKHIHVLLLKSRVYVHKKIKSSYCVSIISFYQINHLISASA